MQIPSPFMPPARKLLGPGPSDVPPSVLEAMSRPLLGHLDPAFIRMMEEIKQMLRVTFETRNEMTFPVSGTGSAGMEFCFANLIEKGDPVVIGVNGVFGTRMVDVAERCGATVTRVDAPWGQIVEAGAIAEAVKTARPKLIAVVQAETSTGALTPIAPITEIARSSGALLLVDAVTSLGGCPVKVDEWGIDAIYSGTQKCLSCPPGLAPVSLSPRALEVARNRKSKVQSWYLDVNLLASYWGQERVYHHTAPISMNYALHEALRLVLTEGLTARFQRHEQAHNAVQAGLAKMNLSLAAQEGHRLWQLNTIGVPAGVDEAAVRKALLDEHQIEIGAGLGPLKGKIWRLGLMGHNATGETVETFLKAFQAVLKTTRA